ncbi:MAG TPA: hypothetical protein VFP34_16725 [Microlunatus sp.]|nr:hypothetical protein [Microlunatus sp.]
MAYGIITRVPAPVAMYDAIHTALLARTGTDVDGLLLHVGRAIEDGFEVIEVWRSRDDFDRYNRELVAPLIAELAGDTGGFEPVSQEIEEFQIRGLVIPTGGISS